VHGDRNPENIKWKLMVIVWCEEDNPLKDSHIMVLEIQRISVRFMGEKSSSIYQSTTITQTNLSIYLTIHLLYFIGILQSLHHTEYHRQYPNSGPILSTCTRNISPNDPSTSILEPIPNPDRLVTMGLINPFQRK
jgi:hypothetical protein